MIRVTVEMRWAIAWVRLMTILRFIVGADRAGRWAVWGAYRFARFRVNGGKPHRFVDGEPVRPIEPPTDPHIQQPRRQRRGRK